jgi:hypothetical protein
MLKREGEMFYIRDCLEEGEIRSVFQGLPSR